jgi:predicted dehydrogenase
MIYIIGTGPMAQAYAKVLIHLEKEFKVVGRGNESANKFKSEIGVQPLTGGIEAFLRDNNFCDLDYVIITTGTEALMPILKMVLISGAGKILIEKPAAISIDELLENEVFLRPYGDQVFVAYNRRFYASVQEVIKLIAEDGGLESMHFEFTEWAHKIEPLQKAEGVKENWFFANSTHVVDLAFFIAGKPKDWKAYSQSGKLGWHSKTKFAGSGITEKDVLFSYHSNWESAGRWGIELMTSKRKFYLKPLELIDIQKVGSVLIESHEFDKELDILFKPGLLLQLNYFINNKNELLSLNLHIENSKLVYSKILN